MSCHISHIVLKFFLFYLNFIHRKSKCSLFLLDSEIFITVFVQSKKCLVYNLDVINDLKKIVSYHKASFK